MHAPSMCTLIDRRFRFEKYTHDQRGHFIMKNQEARIQEKD
jgi:hypothetical protein